MCFSMWDGSRQLFMGCNLMVSLRHMVSAYLYYGCKLACLCIVVHCCVLYTCYCVMYELINVLRYVGWFTAIVYGL